MPFLKPSRGQPLNKSNLLVRGLVACWLFNEGCGSKVCDLSSHANTGTLTDSIWTAGNSGSAIDCSGNTGENYFDISTMTRLTSHSTIIVWLKRDNPSRTEYVFDDSNHDFLCYLTSDSAYFYPNLGGGSGYLQASISWDTNWHQLVMTFDDNTDATNIYFDGQEKASGTKSCSPASVTDFSFGISRDSSGYRFDGKFGYILAYNRPLSAAEIAYLYRDPFCIFEWVINPTLAYVPTINLAGTSTAQSTTSAAVKLAREIGSSVSTSTDLTALMKPIRKVYGTLVPIMDITALLKLTRNIVGMLDGLATVNGLLSFVGEATLVGITETTATLAGILTLSYHGPWLSSPLKIERQWLVEALFDGMTANAFKLSTVTTGGWFWMRRFGCSVLYRGSNMEQIDFSNILSVAEQDASSISPPSFIPHNSGSTYFYIIRRINNCGYHGCTLGAAVKVSIDAKGNLAEPQPNNIFAWQVGQVDSNKVRLIWFYCPLEQKSNPVRFKVYYDGAMGQINYENPITEISYRGRKFHSWQSEALSGGKYLFAIKAEDVDSIQNNSFAQLAIEIVSDTPDAIEILRAETF